MRKRERERERERVYAHLCVCMFACICDSHLTATQIDIVTLAYSQVSTLTYSPNYTRTNTLSHSDLPTPKCTLKHYPHSCQRLFFLSNPIQNSTRNSQTAYQYAKRITAAIAVIEMLKTPLYLTDPFFLRSLHFKIHNSDGPIVLFTNFTPIDFRNNPDRSCRSPGEDSVNITVCSSHFKPANTNQYLLLPFAILCTRLGVNMHMCS